MNSSPERIAVCFGGPSPEHDVSVVTGLQAVHAVAQMPAPVTCIALYWSTNGTWFEVPVATEAAGFAAGAPTGAKEVELVVGPDGGFVRRGRLGKTEQVVIDAVINACHGGPGEDGTLQASLDLAGIPYSGPSVLGAALGMDKLATAALLSGAGLPTLPRRFLDARSPEPEFAGPYIIKPRTGGSSIGIDVVADFATARARLTANVHLRHGAVIEPFRSDLFDLQLAVRSWPELELSAIERPLRKGSGDGILDYADKYVGSEGMMSAPRELPALIADDVADKILEYGRVAAGVFGIRGVARIDFLSNGTDVFVNELNTIPGSLSRYLFISPLVSFNELLMGLANEAIVRPTANFSSAGADGTLLRNAASIASKLG